MDTVNRLTGAMVGGLTSIVSGFGPWTVLLTHAVIIAALALAVYALVSNQRAIRRTRNRAVARVLEIRLFQDDPIAVFAALGRTLTGTSRYFAVSLKPLMVLVPIVVLWITQLASWLEWRPLTPGESVVVAIKLRPGVSPVSSPASLEVPEGFSVETPAFRSLSANEVAWRVRAAKAARGSMRCNAGGVREEKEIVAGPLMEKTSPRRVSEGFWQRVLWPAERALGPDPSITEIRVDYPRRSLRMFGLEVHWLVGLFVASVGVGWIFKRPLGVEF